MKNIKSTRLNYYLVGGKIYHTNDKGLKQIRENVINEYKSQVQDIPEKEMPHQNFNMPKINHGHGMEPYLLYLDHDMETALGKCSYCGINMFFDFPNDVIQWFVFEGGEFRTESLPQCNKK